MITTVAWHEDLGPLGDDFVVDHEPQEHVQVLTALPMGPDVLYRYLVIGRYNGAGDGDD